MARSATLAVTEGEIAECGANSATTPPATMVVANKPDGYGRAGQLPDDPSTIGPQTNTVNVAGDRRERSRGNKSAIARSAVTG